MYRIQFLFALLASAGAMSCQSPTSLRQELCREYTLNSYDGPSGRLFLGESGHYVFEWQGYSCVGAFVPLRYASGTWKLLDNQVHLEPDLDLIPGGLHVIRSGRAFILANDFMKPHLDRQLERWDAVLPMSLGDFRSAGVKVVSEEELMKIRLPPPSTPAETSTPTTPGSPVPPNLPSVPASAPAHPDTPDAD